MATATNCPHSLAAAVREVAAKGLRGLLVTSTGPGEGKTSLVAGLGRALAVSGPESVLLVDLDSFHPALHRECGLVNGRGLGDLLEEVYQFDLMKEDPIQFGIGDWLELLRAQRRTGELRVADGERDFTLQIVKGLVCGISGPVAADEVRLGEVLLRNGGSPRSRRRPFSGSSARPASRSATSSRSWATFRRSILPMLWRSRRTSGFWVSSGCGARSAVSWRWPNPVYRRRAASSPRCPRGIASTSW